jgi:protoporphyrinogen oxidase
MKSVCIIGGGISGIAASIFLKKAGYDVSLFESTSKLGGRTYSIFDRYLNISYDNGKHILAGWYKNTFELLNILGTKETIINSKFRLAIAYKDILLVSSEKSRFSILDYLLLLKKIGLIKWADLWNVFIQFKKIRSSKVTESYNIGSFLSQHKVSDNLLYFFWLPIVNSIFNCDLEQVDLKNFKNLISSIGFNLTNLSFFCPDKTLDEIFIQPAVKFFQTYGVKYHLNSKVSEILIRNFKVQGIIVNGEIKNNFDYYVSAVSADKFHLLFDKIGQSIKSPKEFLHFNPIISVNIFIDDNLLNNRLKDATSLMLAIFHPIPLWLFKNGQNYLSFIISNAGKYVEYEKNQILFLCIKVLQENNLANLNQNNIRHFSVIKERSATIIPGHKQFNLEIFSDLPSNLLLCGDWTSKAGFSTIESAVSSSKLILKKLEEIERQN